MKFNPRIWVFIGTLYVVYILYITLLPFNFSIEVIQSNLGNIEWTKKIGSHYFLRRNFDAIANILFFIPLGVIIYNALQTLGKSRRVLSKLGIVTLCGFVLSLVIEVTQLFIEARTTSLIDILMNTVGCFLGALIVEIFTLILSRANRVKIARFIGKIPTVFFLIPFILLSFLLNENTSFEFLKSGKIEKLYFSWEYFIKPSWIWLLFYAYIPVSILITKIIHDKLKLSSKLFYFISSVFSAVVIIGITEFIKYSGDISAIRLGYFVSAIIGPVVGILIYEVLLMEKTKRSESQRIKIIYILSGLMIFFGSVILYKAAYPLKFNVSHDYLFNKSVFSLLSIYSFVPFSGFLKLFIYTIQNILLFIPIGIMLSEYERHIDFKKNIYILALLSSILIILSFILKILNENQIPFLFEVPTNVFGIFLGYFIWFGFRRGNGEVKY